MPILLAALVALTFGVSAADAGAPRKAKKQVPTRLAKTVRSHGDPWAYDFDVPFGPRIRLADVSGDGKLDTILVDLNRDGKWDGGTGDRDRDGKFDYVWRDRNRDGKPQAGEIEPIRRAPARNECEVGPRVYDIGCFWPATSMAGEKTVVEDPNVFPSNSYVLELGDGKRAYMIGTKGGAKIVGEGDPIVVEDPNIFANNSYAMEIGGKTVIVIGTKGGGKVVGTAGPIIVEDPNIFPNNSYAMEIGGKTVLVIGTKGGARIVTKGPPIWIEDPGHRGREYELDLDHDGKPDAVVRGPSC